MEDLAAGARSMRETKDVLAEVETRTPVGVAGMLPTAAESLAGTAEGDAAGGVDGRGVDGRGVEFAAPKGSRHLASIVRLPGLAGTWPLARLIGRGNGKLFVPLRGIGPGASHRIPGDRI